MKNPFYVHKSVNVDHGAEIGKNCKIWHNSHITSSAIIGENTTIGQNCYIAGVIGNNCRLQNNVNVYEKVLLSDYVFCGPNMTFTNDPNPHAKYPQKENWLETRVEQGVSFGAGCVVLCGTTIGEWALIGAGSVVTKDVNPFSIAYGVPAVLKGWICECREKLPTHFVATICRKCKRKYKYIYKKVVRVV